MKRHCERNEMERGNLILKDRLLHYVRNDGTRLKWLIASYLAMTVLGKIATLHSQWRYSNKKASLRGRRTKQSHLKREIISHEFSSEAMIFQLFQDRSSKKNDGSLPKTHHSTIKTVTSLILPYSIYQIIPSEGINHVNLDYCDVFVITIVLL
jgi:hypothetical protein